MTNLSGTNFNNRGAVGPKGEGRNSPSGFPQYPEYKDSGVGWLGDLPAHWGSRRLKFLFQLKKRSVRESDGIVTCFRDGTVTLRANKRTDGFTNALKEIGYQGVRVGDLVIHAMDAFAGAIGVSDSDGKSSPVYSVCTPVNDEVSSPYYARLLRYMALSGFVASLAKGIRERSTDFRWSDAAEIRLPVPAGYEQTQIARFLDYETARIDALIEEQQRLIELLKEKRQAVISHAVTKGLDPNAPMKDSGVEWLGEVPEHWAVGKLSHRYSVQLGKMLDEKQITGRHLVPYLRNRDVQWGNVLTDDLPLMDIQDKELDRFTVKNGDLLVCEGGEVGRCAIWRGRDGEIGYQKALHRLRPKDFMRDEAEYFYYMLLTSVNLGIFEQTEAKATIAHLPAEQFRQYKFVFPPKEEQVDIVAYTKEKLLVQGKLLEQAKRAIDLLTERRSALISAAVTGKIDLRNWQQDGGAA